MNYSVFQILERSSTAIFYFRLKTSSGQTILAGEGYATKQACQAGILSIKKNSLLDNCYERNNINANYSFNLRNGNGEVICRSENYITEAAREDGIARVKWYAPYAAIEN